MLSYFEDVLDQGKRSKKVWRDFLPGPDSVDGLSEQARLLADWKARFLEDWKPGVSHDIWVADCFPQKDNYGFLRVIIQTPGLRNVSFTIQEEENGSFYARSMAVMDELIIE